MEDDKQNVEDQLQQMTLEDNKAQEEQPPRGFGAREVEELPTKPLPEIVKELNTFDPITRLNAVRQIRKLLAQEVNPPIQQVLESGALPKLVSYLGNEDEQDLQLEAAWSLTNIASGTSEQTQALVAANAVPQFVALLTSKNDEIREQAVWALGNIAGDSFISRDYVLGANAMGPLLHCLTTSSRMIMIRNAVWTVSNLCRGRPAPDFDLVAPAIPVLAGFLGAPDVEMLTDACWSLSYLTDGSDDRIEKVLKEESIVPQLVELLDHPNGSVQTPALRTIGNILTGEEAHTQAVLDCPMALPLLKKLLHDPKNNTRKEGCWALSNITAGSPVQIQRVIDAGVIPLVVAMVLSNEETQEIKQEAVWVLGNIFSGGSNEQIVYLVGENVVSVFLSYLDNVDNRSVMVCLEGIERVLELGEQAETNPYVAKIKESGEFDKLEELLEHDNPTIYERTRNIIDKFFEGEDDEEECLQPSSETASFSF